MSLLPREQAHAVTAPAPRFDPHERPHGARDSRAYRAREPVHQHPEIDCVRSLLSPGIAEAAEHRADRIGVGADRVLIAAGSLSEDRYVTALAAHLGIPFEPLETVPRHACMLSDERLPAAAAAGLLPLRLSSDFVWVVAPRGVAARRLIGLVRLHPVLRERLRLTTAARITRFANQHGSRSVGLLAADGLRTAKPQFSAATRSRFHPLLLAAAAIGICAAIAPVISVAVLDAALATLFLGCILMRFAAAALRVKPTRVEPVNDQSLPTYTIIVALYREARAVPGLVHALKQLDYPAEKLDIKFVIEPDDRETKEAFARARLGPPFEIIVAPISGPRTKPKALNAALPFARGAYTVIYDAEDRPEPDQLRQAIASFRSETEHLACVQARLTIDNTADSLLTRLFTAEYAGLFDVFLPGLADRDLPLPLGGSSNHFRTDILRAIGAWDPYNVTEDADLGMRLARFGYHSHVIRSTTYEEAPARLTPWIKQRTRWFKGWMQTYLVHMRAPRALKRDLGWSGFIIFQLVVGGAVLSALVHPIFVTALAMNIIDGSFLSSNASPTEFAFDVLHLVTLMASYLASGFLGALGLMRRKLLASVWVLGFMPIHWMLLSIAAWRAIFQLIINPFHWEKTEHGLARTSRRVTPASIKYGAEDPRRLRQASVSN